MTEEYPKGPKSSWAEQARQIALGHADISLEEVPVLLTWLKDLNWPGSDDIVQYLSGFEGILQEPVRSVLVSGDQIWCKWVLHSFSNIFKQKFWKPLDKELEALVHTNDEEGACIEALYILWVNNLRSVDWVKQSLSLLKTNQSYEMSDFDRFDMPA